MLEITCTQPLGEGQNPPCAHGESLSFKDNRHKLRVLTAHPAKSVATLVQWLDEQGFELCGIEFVRPSLEDVFVELTGRGLRE